MVKTVLADGNFDGLHFGHIEHLNAARELGDRLVVALATDEHVAKRKGPGRPRFPLAKRLNMLNTLRCVDEVIVANDSFALVASLKPAVYVKGKEYDVTDSSANPEHHKMVALVQSYGGQVAYTDTMLASSSELLNLVLPHDGPLGEFITTFKKRCKLAHVLMWLERASKLRCMVVGEPIADVYVYCKPAMKSAKENIISYVPTGSETYEGGSLAVKRHIEQLCPQSYVDTQEMPAVIKRRWVAEPFNQKVFSEEVIAPTRREPHAWQSSHLASDLDLAVVADYGHGMFPDREACEAFLRAWQRRFIALTCQSNSLNWGFNLLTKWPGANYVVVDEMELRLCRHDDKTDLRELAVDMAIQIRRQDSVKPQYLAVTLGHQGCLVIGDDGEYRCPALAEKLVDRMGAGDAFLAWTAPLAALGAPSDIIALVGNVAGAIKCGIKGNSEPVRKEVMVKWLKSLLA